MPELQVDLSPVLYRISSVESRVQDIQVSIPPMVQALSVIGAKVHAIDGQVQVILERQDETRRLLGSLYQEFQEYVNDYLRRTELQLAETRIVKVRQELEQRFGHYEEVRRRVTGILQATDLSLVRQETIRTTAEELMLAAPRYWLAPALIALMGWIVDEQDISERALVEALRRDEYKACLFLTLLCRRASRWESMNLWLGLYLALLDPLAIDREVVVILDAVATGMLGRRAQEVFWRTSLEWIKVLQQVPGQVEEQSRRWLAVLDAERGDVGQEEFKVLRAHSTTWPRLEAALANARRNHRVAERFRRILQGPSALPSSVTAAVDELLDVLVTRFDDEELPLRRSERLLQLIIDQEGDRKRAEQEMELEEQALKEKVSFVARLSDILMHPEQAGATLASQRYAAAFSRDWILAAHRLLVQRDQAQAPAETEISLADWRGTIDGVQGGEELAGSVRQHYAAKTQREVAAIKLPIYSWLAPSVGLAFVGLWAAGVASATFALSLLALGAGLFLLGRRIQGKRREAHAAKLAKEMDEALQTLAACLEDFAGYLRVRAAAQAQAQEVEVLLESIVLGDDVDRGAQGEPPALLGDGATHAEIVRRATPGGFRAAQLAEQLAGWDLLPPRTMGCGTSGQAN
jgi:hypothetical protein